MTTTFDLDTVVEQITTIVNENPDNVARCVYADREHGVPVCVVGHWLHRFVGVSLDRLTEFEGQRVRSVLRMQGIRTERDARKFLSTIQREQDEGSTWKDALSCAVDRFEDNS